ncbi:MAG: tetratricopeptide repeat protein [bacterium]
MLTLLIVSFLIGTGIASVLVLAMRSRKVPKGSSRENSGLDADLISGDQTAEPVEPGRGGKLRSRLGSGIPKPYSPPGDIDAEPIPVETAGFGSMTRDSATPEPMTSQPAVSESVTADPETQEPEVQTRQEQPTPSEPLPALGSNTIEFDPLEDEGFSEARLIETGRLPFAERDEPTSGLDEPPHAESAMGADSSPELKTDPDKQAGLRALLSRPRELVIEYGLPDPPVLDAWRPLGTSSSDSEGGGDTTSAGVHLPGSFSDVLRNVSQAVDEEERKGEIIPPETFYHLAILCFYAGEFEAAVAYVQMTLDSGTDSARALNLLGLTFHMQGFEPEAETRLREAAEMAGVSPLDRAMLLTNLGLVSTYRRAPDDALGYYGQALEIQRQEGDGGAQAQTLSRMGRLCRAKHSLNESSKYHHEALEIWRQLEDRSKEALELRLLAAVFREKGDFSEALDLSRSALEMNRELGDPREEAINLGNIGLIYNVEKDLSKALEQFEAALSLHQEVGNLKGEASNLGNIGNLLFLQGNTADALQAYRKALEINQSIGYRWGEAVDLGNIGKIQMHENDLAAAGGNLREAHRIFTELNANPQAEAIQNTLSQISAHVPPEP